jgi:hypothetical protein
MITLQILFSQVSHGQLAKWVLLLKWTWLPLEVVDWFHLFFKVNRRNSCLICDCLGCWVSVILLFLTLKVQSTSFFTRPVVGRANEQHEGCRFSCYLFTLKVNVSQFSFQSFIKKIWFVVQNVSKIIAPKCKCLILLVYVFHSQMTSTIWKYRPLGFLWHLDWMSGAMDDGAPSFWNFLETSCRSFLATEIIANLIRLQTCLLSKDVFL